MKPNLLPHVGRNPKTLQQFQVFGKTINSIGMYIVTTLLYTIGVEFEWDDAKARANYNKHRVRFAEAASIWLDAQSLEIPDPEHSSDEDRWIRIGVSQHLRALVVVYVEKVEGKRIRIISARKADKTEEATYLERSSTEGMSYEE